MASCVVPKRRRAARSRGIDSRDAHVWARGGSMNDVWGIKG
jgi:hypothetical protein